VARSSPANLADLLTRHADAAPGDTALIAGATTLRYGELEALVWGLCRHLREAGIEPGMVTGLGISQSPLHLAALLALARIGAVCVPISTSKAEAAVASAILARTGASALVDTAAGEAAGAGPRLIPLDARAAFALRGEPDATLRCTPDSGLLLYKSSSGTTGAPKIVAETHAGMALSIEREIASIGYPRQERYMTPVALRFDAPRRRYLACLAAGGTCVMLPAACSPAAIAERIEQADVRHFSGVASHADRMAALEHPARPRFPRMRVFRLSAGPAYAPLLERVRERLTPNVWISYGCSELGPLTVADPELLARRPGSVGRPMPGVELELAGPAGEPLPPGSTGRVRLRVRGMPGSYFGDEAASARSFRDGWFLPQDIGRLDADGTLSLLGRADDMMVYDGMNVYPAEIEHAMFSHPDVADCKAFALLHQVVNHMPACAVVLREGAAATGEDLIAHARTRLGARAPERIVFLEAMPRNEHGKIAKEPFTQAVNQRLPKAQVR
jgi:acyl-coenzyme A synthetase/AMP-(fatty) acid ligase